MYSYQAPMAKADQFADVMINMSIVSRTNWMFDKIHACLGKLERVTFL